MVFVVEISGLIGVLKCVVFLVDVVFVNVVVS